MNSPALWANRLDGQTLGLAACGVLALLILIWTFGRQRSAASAHQIAALASALQHANAELTGRVRSMGETLGDRQNDLARLVAERLDSVNARMGQTLERSAHRTGEGLARLNERLAVIDAAQARLTGLTEEIVGLRDVLSNKQARGAYGQGRMEAIVRDGLPPDAYQFQPTLSNRTRPDCLVRLPGDRAALVIDAKFPLEGFAALREADGERARAEAAARVRTDMGKHIRDIADRYFVPGETQDTALLFVPSESVFADLSELFPDVLQKASRARISVVSPTLLALAIQLMRSVARDARMREEAHLIQAEVRGLMAEVRRLAERVGKLDDHFRLARKDVSDIAGLTDRIVVRGEKIDALDYASPPMTAAAERPRAERAPTAALPTLFGAEDVRP